MLSTKRQSPLGGLQDYLMFTEGAFFSRWLLVEQLEELGHVVRRKHGLDGFKLA